MKILFSAFVYFIALWLDLFFSNNGYETAFCMIAFIYITVSYSWLRALPFGLVSVVIYDNLTGLQVTNCLLFFILLGEWWKSSGDCSRLGLMWIPYFGGVFFQFAFFYLFLNLNKILVIQAFLEAVILTIPLGLLLTWLLNRIAHFFNLPHSTLNEAQEHRI